MQPPIDTDLARRARIARLLMVTACAWGITKATRSPLFSLSGFAI